MFDPTEYVMELADAMIETFEDDLANVSAEKEQAYIAFAYGIYDRMTELRHKTLQFAAEYIEAEAANRDIFKSAAMNLAALALRERMAVEKEELQTGLTLPDFVPDGLDKDDPYEDYTAGLEPPQQSHEAAICGAENPMFVGAVCNREVHPPHWKHWTVADMTMGDADNAVTTDRIVATWYSDGDIESFIYGQ
jgi:hypothetical protein